MTWRILLRLMPSDLRESTAGDLEEEYAARIASRGRVRATAWAWWTAARIGLTFRVERAAHGRPLPPIGDDVRSTNMWDSVRQDTLFGLRMLRRQPGFTVVAVLALALGIGANTAIFSIVDAVLWRPLPYPGAGELISIGEQRPRENRIHGPVAPADFYDWRDQAGTLAAIAAIEPKAVNLTGASEPERIPGIAVTAGFLEVLGIKPALGRGFVSDEEISGRHRVALLSDGLWRRRFAASASVVGEKITANENPYQIIGVLPASFWWPSNPEIVLLYPRPGSPTRALHSMEVIARTKPRIPFDEARAEVEAIGARLSAQYVQENRYHGPHFSTLQQSMVGDIRPALLSLLGAVGLVLLIACANVATLLLGKATSRQREIAVRLAIGAGRGRLVRQLITESLVLAAIGGAAGVLAAAWGVSAFRAAAPASFGALPGIARVGIDARMLFVALAVSLTTGIAFGIIPALTGSDTRLSSALHEQSRGSTGGTRSSRTRAVLVVVELALSLVLLIGATLLLVSFRRVLDVSPGFEPENIVVASIVRSDAPPQAVAFYERLLERVRAMPGIEAAALATPLPFGPADGRASFGIEGRTGESPIPVRARPRLISPGYFATMHIPLVRGRVFSARDTVGSPDVVIINAAAVRRYWPDEDPIGRRITFFSNNRWFEIVGIVGDVKHAGLEQDTEPEAYVPFRQPSFAAAYAQRLSVVVRTHAPLSAMAPSLRSAVREIDRNQPVGAISAMEDLIADSVAPRRLNLWLVAAFAVVAVVLTAAGVYGVMSYLVAQRTHEIGVRLALGASPRSVIALVIRQAGTMTAIGIVLGLAAAIAVSRFIGSVLFGVSATDPGVYLAVSGVLAVVALAAATIPSSRATRIDPLCALRAE